MNYKESSKLELKEQFTSDIKKEIVAFLNCDGGTLIIGVNDDENVTGVSDAKSVIERISAMIHEAIRPDPSLICSAEEYTDNGKTLVKVEIGRGVKKPYYISEKGLKPSGVYLRINNTSQQASEYAIKQMIMESENNAYETLPCMQSYLTFDYLNFAFKRAGLEVKEKTLGIKNSDGEYTNLALLLSDQCPFSIKAAVFNDDYKSNFVDRKVFCGSLLKQADDAYEYLRLNNKKHGDYDGLVRRDQSDYNDLVLREGLLNCLIHRDYSLNGSNIINIYPDRIEYISIGGLISGMTYADMMLGVSRTRNEKLADIFFRLNYVEAYGTGVKKIQGDYTGTPFSPKFEVSDNGFLLVLPNKTVQVKSNHSDEEIVYNFIAGNDKVTRADIQEHTGYKLTKTRSIIFKLIQNGKIKKYGNGKSVYYSIH